MTRAGTRRPAVDVVIPTVGRPSLNRLLESLDRAGCRPGRVLVVDDRSGLPEPLPLASRNLPIRVVGSGGRGSAAACNTGLAWTTAPWVVFLDDDVVVTAGWWMALWRDLRSAGRDVAGVQARIDVPLPSDRRPTDWERNGGRPATARWITADLAVRRAALDSAAAFDEGFRQVYREDLQLRLEAAGWRFALGERHTIHPVQPAGVLASLRAQAGSADDERMRAKHGPGLRRRMADRRWLQQRHLATTVAALVAVMASLTGRRRAGIAAGAGWAASTAWFSAQRIAPGPRDPEEIARTVVTSVLIPPAATVHRALGWVRARGLRRGRHGPAARVLRVA